MNLYPYTPAQGRKLDDRPRISGAFAIDKNLWHGRDVAVIVINRGDYHRRTARRLAYGVLDLTAGDASQFGVTHRDGTTTIIHKSRGVDIYDMTRTKTVSGRHDRPTKAGI